MYFVVRNPATHQLLTLNPGKFASKKDLEKSIGESFLVDGGYSIQLDDCEIVEVSETISELAISESTGHKKNCLCVACSKRKYPAGKKVEVKDENGKVIGRQG